MLWLRLFVVLAISSLIGLAVAHDRFEHSSDGSKPRLLRDINRGTQLRDSDPAEFFGFRGDVYFSASTIETGRELWKTDGTRSGTRLVKDLNPGTGAVWTRRGHSPGAQISLGEQAAGTEQK